MTTEAAPKAKPVGNIYDRDITMQYTLAVPEPRKPAYDFQVYDLKTDDEHYMAQAFHQQYVAIEGRAAIGQLINTRVGEMAIHASYVMGDAMQHLERIESEANLGRLGRRFLDFDNKLVDQTARHILETNAIAVRSMHEDMRRSPYPPPPPKPLPEPPKRKGLIPAIFEFLFGEL